MKLREFFRWLTIRKVWNFICETISAALWLLTEIVIRIAYYGFVAIRFVFLTLTVPIWFWIWLYWSKCICKRR